jgi:hypothetical protein
MKQHLFGPPDAPIGDVDEEIEEVEEDMDNDTAADGSDDFNDWEE